MSAQRPRFFATPAAFRAWLEKHHAKAAELMLGFYKRDSGRPSITWPESVDEALCFGWIDGVRRSLSDESYVIRFTPRRPTSTWSTINTRRMRALIAEGRARRAGIAAFEARSEQKTGIYAYEQRHSAKLPAAFERRLRANRAAWAYFQDQPPWYRAITTWWVVSAKQEATRERRLLRLIACSADGRPIDPLLAPKLSGSKSSPPAARRSPAAPRVSSAPATGRSRSRSARRSPTPAPRRAGPATRR